MLLKFSVSNFRSIAETQTLSMIGSGRDQSLPQNYVELKQRGLTDVRVLKAAAVYGANASGKSNAVRALGFLTDLVTRSALRIRPDAPIPITPFCLSRDWCDAPSEFAVTMLADSIRYDYEVALTKSRIIRESLTAYPKGSPQVWYLREWDSATAEYVWPQKSPQFHLDSALKSKVRDNALLLSVGTQFNHDQLRPVYEWFAQSLSVLHLGGNIGPTARLSKDPTAKLFEERLDLRRRIQMLMRSSDFGLLDTSVTHEKEKADALFTDLEGLPEEQAVTFKKLTDVLREIVGDEGEFDRYNVSFVHRSEQGLAPNVSIEFDEESDGTQRYFSLLGPWLSTLANSTTLVIDELETSLHPILVRELVRLANASELNPKGGQVIFTTHSPLLLDMTLLRRDQVWFTEKLANGQTRLYPLTDFSPRKSESLLKGYLSGRYGGIPLIPDRFGEPL